MFLLLIRDGSQLDPVCFFFFLSTNKIVFDLQSVHILGTLQCFCVCMFMCIGVYIWYEYVWRHVHKCVGLCWGWVQGVRLEYLWALSTLYSEPCTRTQKFTNSVTQINQFILTPPVCLPSSGIRKGLLPYLYHPYLLSKWSASKTLTPIIFW